MLAGSTERYCDERGKNMHKRRNHVTNMGFIPATKREEREKETTIITVRHNEL